MKKHQTSQQLEAQALEMAVLNVKKKGRVLFWQQQEYQSKYVLGSICTLI